jgi:outer membrane protein assembly factor BamB
VSGFSLLLGSAPYTFCENWSRALIPNLSRGTLWLTPTSLGASGQDSVAFGTGESTMVCFCLIQNRALPTFWMFVLAAVAVSGASFAQDDWARWRGPTGDGMAAEGQTPPSSWSEDTNVVWKAEVPGRGHASPIVVGDRIFLATAEEDTQTQSVICYDRITGNLLWKTDINQGAFTARIHPKNTHASQTVAVDGERVFVVFNNHGLVQLAALDFDGNKLWNKEVGPFKSRYPFGYGSSPIVYNGTVIVANLNQTDAAITAFDGTTGTERWRADRGPGTSYSTPVVANVAGKEQLLLSGARQVTAYDPVNGKQLWSAPGRWDVTCGTMVWIDDVVFASGGFPAQQTMAIKADGSGDVVWENGVKVYEQSMLEKDGYLYAHADNNVVYCWRASDGKEMWKQKFSSRKVAVSASPVYANGCIYFTAENGQTLVVRANPETFEEVSRNKLGDESFASLAICGNQIFTRVAMIDPISDERQEWLFCLGKTK